MESITDVSDAIVIVSGSQNIAYTCVSMLALLIYDWLILLDREVGHVWRSEWSIPKVLFIIARYGAFLDMPILVTVITVPYGAIDSNACNILYKIMAWSSFFGVSISESILLLRTIAIYSRSKWVAIPLSIGYTVGTVGGIIVIWYYLHTTLVAAPSVPWLSGCSLSQTSGKIFFQTNYLTLLVFELVIIILTVRRLFSDFYSGTPLLTVIYRDSIGFFLVLFALTLSAILVHTVVSPQSFNFLSISVRVVHSIVCCRILLNLRRAASPVDDPTTTRLTCLVFATAPTPETNQADAIRLETQDDEEGSSLGVLSRDTTCNR